MQYQLYKDRDSDRCWKSIGYGLSVRELINTHIVPLRVIDECTRPDFVATEWINGGHYYRLEKVSG